MANEYEVLINLFDFYWFENQILGKTAKPISSNPVLDMNTDAEFEQHSPLMKLSQTPSFMVRSYSDQALSSSLDLGSSSDSNSSSSPSPKSVLHGPKLETIYSGKEVGGFPVKSEVPPADNTEKNGADISYSEGRKTKNRGKRRGINGSRSLSELEFEELKGFMDLGFVFSDEDKDDSSLVSIIPGLQRLGKNVSAGTEENRASRPYLSEAWAVLETEAKAQKLKKKDQILMNLRISATGNNDSEVKNQLKFWAHSVASTVR
ncbi:OLC1v1023678C1 [Oldenlandia corymbosa var. corymbosa]|uniref:OLC1v1023678C1 n=1 Tax=Oldenlandia corymbosa var. corymbosa TaxID=529605 RepID=A0AAV1C1A3_OLDCO|nr:OLC1v1023678C1 [Oldenlandia corymbosa var. corymbosa]